jgi:hypothetical protein
VKPTNIQKFKTINSSVSIVTLNANPVHSCLIIAYLVQISSTKFQINAQIVIYHATIVMGLAVTIAASALMDFI